MSRKAGSVGQTKNLMLILILLKLLNRQTERASVPLMTPPHTPRVYQRQRLLLTLRLTQTKSRKAPAASVNTL